VSRADVQILSDIWVPASLLAMLFAAIYLK
jgi:hypothetical protein